MISATAPGAKNAPGGNIWKGTKIEEREDSATQGINQTSQKKMQIRGEVKNIQNQAQIREFKIGLGQGQWRPSEPLECSLSN